MKSVITLLASSVLAFGAAAGSDTIAFYPFCDAAIGENALVTVTNAAREGTMACVVGGKGSAPQVVFSAEVPGRYLYSSSKLDAELLASNLQSIDLGQGEAGVSSAFLSIPDAAQALAECHDTGYTVEFFFRIPSQTPFSNYSATLQYHCGYKFEGNEYPFQIFLPSDTGRRMRYGLNGYGGTNGAKGGFAGNVDFSANLNNGAWHHFAVVEKVDGSTVSVNFYVDYVLVKTHVLPASVERGELAAATPEFKLVRGNLSGNLAGLRLSARTLSLSEFLVATDRAPGNYGGDVLGFYPFDDGADGASAVGRTVFNAALPQLSPCTVKTNSANSVAQFSSEGPAKYIFAGEEYGAKPYYTDPGSVFLTSSGNGDSGTLDFYRMASELSKCHESGHTVEWFFKLTDEAITPYVSSYYCRAGYLYNGNDKSCSVYLPFSMGLSYDGGRQLRFSLGSYSDGRCVTKTLDYLPMDGLWHHAAVVARDSRLQFYVDYVFYCEVSVDGSGEISSDRSLELVRNALHGRFSCVKVTKRALGTGEFLRASNVSTYWPRTLTHATFDAESEGAFPSVVENAAASFAGINPAVFAAQDVSGAFTAYGVVSGNPACSDNRACRRPMVSGEGEDRANLTSVYVASTDPGNEYFRSAPYFRMPVSSRHTLPADFTMEGFFRFDKMSWARNVGAYATARDRLCLVSRKHSDGYSWKLNFVDALSQTSHRLLLTMYYGTQTGDFVDAITPLGILKDDTWHHIAVTHDSAQNRMTVYCDYKAVIVKDIGEKTLYCPSSGWVCVGDGKSVSDNNFHGWIDEVRYSNVCLKPEEFLRQTKAPAGMSIKIR